MTVKSLLHDADYISHQVKPLSQCYVSFLWLGKLIPAIEFKLDLKLLFLNFIKTSQVNIKVWENLLFIWLQMPQQPWPRPFFSASDVTNTGRSGPQSHQSKLRIKIVDRLRVLKVYVGPMYVHSAYSKRILVWDIRRLTAQKFSKSKELNYFKSF